MRMDALLEINQQTQQRRLERQTESQYLFERGCSWLQKFLIEEPDKEKLKQAASCFSKGIQVQRKNPDNYAGLGFLFYLTGDFVQAVTLLQNSLELDASHLMAQELLQALQKPPDSQNTQPGSEQLPTIAQSSQFESLYDQCRLNIFQALKQLMRDELRQLRPSLNPADFEKLTQYQQSYQLRYTQLQSQLKTLDQEIDCTDLHRLLMPLEKVLFQLQKLSSAFKAFADFRDRIQIAQLKARALTVCLHDANRPAIPVLEQRLEQLLDQCDGFADQLDELESQNWSIEPLKVFYGTFKAELESFIELFEDIQENHILQASRG